MTDRWSRTEEYYRQRQAERRYRRDEQAWARSEEMARIRTNTPPRRPARHSGAHHRENWDQERPEWDDRDPGLSYRERYPEDFAEEPAGRRRPKSRDSARQPRQRRGHPVEHLPAEHHSAAPSPPRRRQSRQTRSQAREAPTAARSPRRRSSRSERDACQTGSRRRSAAPPKRRRSTSRRRGRPRQTRRLRWILLGLVAVVVVGFLGMKLWSRLMPAADFSGPVGDLAVVQVHPGDTAAQLAQTLYQKGVVASPQAFYSKAIRNDAMGALQPGYYAVPSHSPAKEAVSTLASPKARVGNVVISSGRQLHDQHDVTTGARKEGIYTKIAAASCLGTGPTQHCTTAEQLAQAGASTDSASLGVPQWAMDGVQHVPDRARQLEGLIGAGTWDFDPSGTPQQILRQLVTESADSYETTGLLQSSAPGMNPYQTLIGASLVEREAVGDDMGKVARVIVNRLAAGQKLEFDSTVNYALDKTEVATTDADRAKQTPWNTYAKVGLPATPISAPSKAALKAMEKPEPGNWLYFVTVDKQGTTLFTNSYSEHLSNIGKAQKSGILDSGR